MSYVLSQNGKDRKEESVLFNAQELNAVEISS